MSSMWTGNGGVDGELTVCHWSCDLLSCRCSAVFLCGCVSVCFCVWMLNALPCTYRTVSIKHTQYEINVYSTKLHEWQCLLHPQQPPLLLLPPSLVDPTSTVPLTLCVDPPLDPTLAADLSPPFVAIRCLISLVNTRKAFTTSPHNPQAAHHNNSRTAKQNRQHECTA